MDFRIHFGKFHVFHGLRKHDPAKKSEKMLKISVTQNKKLIF